MKGEKEREREERVRKGEEKEITFYERVEIPSFFSLQIADFIRME